MLRRALSCAVSCAVCCVVIMMWLVLSQTTATPTALMTARTLRTSTRPCNLQAAPELPTSGHGVAATPPAWPTMALSARTGVPMRWQSPMHARWQPDDDDDDGIRSSGQPLLAFAPIRCTPADTPEAVYTLDLGESISVSGVQVTAAWCHGVSMATSAFANRSACAWS